ncbi:hypothetical protein BA893_19380 [Vibrio natriegens]|uniref:heme-degrading domain-containing protein n=1 Tax=Vibrio natriegens TaxID=691 RepID=UPI0008042603|nr:heme-degrading domain-containing protein [Vibrio natriegens]ANQ23797.1 hypothetical protein BA893_19380 [Vibrio natriegens]
MSEVPSISELKKQEQLIRIRDFDHDAAWLIGSKIRDKAIAKQFPVAIEVYAYGQTMFLTALPGSSSEHLEWIERKRNTVLRNARSSLLTGEEYKEQQLSMENLPYIDAKRYTDSGGSFPLLTTTGCVFGAVTVSGLASHEDHALAVWAIEQYLTTQ